MVIYWRMRCQYVPGPFSSSPQKGLGTRLTNLRQHLKKAHPDVYSEVSKKDHAEEEKKTKKEAERQKASLKVSQQLSLCRVDVPMTNQTTSTRLLPGN